MSLRSKRRNARNGVEYVRRGTAPIKTVYIPNAPKPRKPKPKSFDEPLSVAKVWGNDAPGGDMAAMRADWLRWEQRKIKQRKRAKR